MADQFNQVAQASDAGRRATLAAIAQAGSAGKQAYEQAQAQLNTSRQQALGYASHQANLIGGAESQAPQFANTIAAPYAAQSANLGQMAASHSQGLDFLRQSNANYNDQLKSALPLARLAAESAQQAAAAKAQGKLSNSAIKTQYLGAATNQIDQIKQANTNEYNASKKASFAAGDSVAAAERKVKGLQSAISAAEGAGKLPGRDFQAYGAPDKKAIAYKNLSDAQANLAAAKKEAVARTQTYKTLKTRGAPSLSQTATQLATADGLDPNRAAGIFTSSIDAKALKESHPLAYKLASKTGAEPAAAMHYYNDYNRDLAGVNQVLAAVTSGKKTAPTTQQVLDGYDREYAGSPQIATSLKTEFMKGLKQQLYLKKQGLS